MKHLGSSPVVGGIRVAHLLSFPSFAFCVVCLRPLSYVHNVASFSGLSFLDCTSVSLTFYFTDLRLATTFIQTFHSSIAANIRIHNFSSALFCNMK